jgi:hypothetical protein
MSLMKRNSPKTKRDLKLKRRLELVRTTIRELTPTQLGQVNGGTETVLDAPSGCIRPYTYITTM